MVPWWLPGCRPPALAAGPVAVAAVTAGALVGLDIAYRHAARGRRMFSRGARHGRSVVGHGMAHPRIRVSARPAPGRRRPSVCARVRFPLLTIDRGSMFCWFGFGGRARLVPDRPRCRTRYAFDSCWLRTGGGGRGRGPRGVRRLCAARGAACTGSGVVQPTRSVSMTMTTMKPVRVRGTLDPQLPPHRWLRCY